VAVTDHAHVSALDFGRHPIALSEKSGERLGSLDFGLDEAAPVSPCPKMVTLYVKS
jgi:hypothetical protein